MSLTTMRKMQRDLKNPDLFQTRNQVMRKMLYISLGEVGSLDLEMTLPIQITIYFVWVVLTNVLLLNLLISMMGQTFSDNTQDTHNAWVFPVANFILRCETHILSRRWKQSTRCGKRGSVVKVMSPAPCSLCPCSQSDCTLAVGSVLAVAASSFWKVYAIDVSIVSKVERGRTSANPEEKGVERGDGVTGTTNVSSFNRTGTAVQSEWNLLNTVNPGADVNSKEIQEKLQRTWTDRYMPWGMSTLQLKR